LIFWEANPIFIFELSAITFLMIKNLKQRLPFLMAAKLMLILFGAVVVFHVLVLVQILPYSIVWGGKLNSVEQMRSMETVSICINLFMILVVLLRAKLIRLDLRPLFLQVVMGLMCALFVLNTLGNILSENTFERLVFTPLTLLLALCCFRLTLSE